MSKTKLEYIWLVTNQRSHSAVKQKLFATLTER
jgi:hypothetical protein